MKGLIFDFIEENWTSFLGKCAESGMSEDEADKEFCEFKKYLHALDNPLMNQSIGRGLRDNRFEKLNLDKS